MHFLLPFWTQKPFLTMKKMKTLFQMTYTIRMVRSKQFIEPGLGVSTYLDFGARLFSTQWPPYGAHILQGLSCNLKQNKNIWNAVRFSPTRPKGPSWWKWPRKILINIVTCLYLWNHKVSLEVVALWSRGSQSGGSGGGRVYEATLYSLNGWEVTLNIKITSHDLSI